jgi:hypothetical protein
MNDLQLVSVNLGRIKQGIVEIFLAPGGKAQAALKHGRQFGHTIDVGADVRGELSSALPDGPPEGVVLLPLGDVATVRSLLRGAPEDVRCAILQFPGVSLAGGHGQLLAVGRLAAWYLRQSREFQKWLSSELPDHLLRLHGGRNLVAIIHVDHSAAGATGAGAGPPLTDALASVFRQRGIRTRVQGHVSGSLSYVELGPRIHKNCAATTVQWLDFIASGDCPETESRSLTLDELPATGTDKTTRDAFAVLVIQARASQDACEHLERFGANRVSRSKLGAVDIQHLNFWGPLSAAAIAENIAPIYVEAIDTLLVTLPSATAIRSIDTEIQAEPRDVEAVDLIFNKIYELSEEVLLAAVGRSPYRYHVEVVADTSSGGRIRLSRAAEIFGVVADSPEEFANRLGLFLAAEESLVSRSRLTAIEVEELSADRQEAEAALVTAATRVLRQRWWDVGRWFASDEGLQEDFCEKALRFREVCDQSLKAKAVHDAVIEALAQVRKEIVHLRERLMHVQGILRPLLPKSPRPPAQLVLPVEFGQVLPRLLDLGDTDAAMRVLASAVAACTMAGLAHLVRTEPRLEDVVARLATGRPELEAPPWGGQDIALVKPQRILVLPPLEPDVARKLRVDFRSQGSGRELAIADTAVGGVGIVEIKVYHPEEMEEVITPFLRHHLVEAVQSEPAIYFPEGLAPLERLGITIPPADPDAKPTNEPVNSHAQS